MDGFKQDTGTKGNSSMGVFAADVSDYYLTNGFARRSSYGFWTNKYIGFPSGFDTVTSTPEATGLKLDGANKVVALKINAGATIIDCNLGIITLILKKVGTPGGTESQDRMTVGVFDNTGTRISDEGDYQDLLKGLVANSEGEYKFYVKGLRRRVVVGDYIGIKSPSTGTWDATNYIEIGTTTTAITNTVASVNSSGSWTDQTGRYLRCRLEGANGRVRYNNLNARDMSVQPIALNTSWDGEQANCEVEDSSNNGLDNGIGMPGGSNHIRSCHVNRCGYTAGRALQNDSTQFGNFEDNVIENSYDVNFLAATDSKMLRNKIIAGPLSVYLLQLIATGSNPCKRCEIAGNILDGKNLTTISGGIYLSGTLNPDQIDIHDNEFYNFDAAIPKVVVGSNTSGIIRIRHNKGFNPVGLIASPFDSANNHIGWIPSGVAFSNAGVTVNTDYKVNYCDIFLTVTITSGTCNVTVKDKNGNSQVFTVSATAPLFRLPVDIEEKVSFSTKTNVTVLVHGR